jgi:hypothetical protein
MFSRIRKRFTYANVTATLALFFAMTGGALAASHYLITSTKQIKPSVLSSLKGKAGAAGANGVNGANGAAGEKGAQGPQGNPGGTGEKGPEGKAGESVTVAATSGSECNKEGGVKVSNASGSKTVCNGKTGYTEHLPSGKTETGSWVISTSGTEVRIHLGLGEATAEEFKFCVPETKAAAEGATLTLPPCKEKYTVRSLWSTGTQPEAAISFPIPLAEPLNHEHVVYVEETGNGTTCPGTSEDPQAEEDYLCVYQANIGQGVRAAASGLAEAFILNAGVRSSFEQGAGPTGAVLRFQTVEENSDGSTEAAEGFGTWAVTAQ